MSRRIDGRVVAGGIVLTLALTGVAASWYVAVLFGALILDMSSLTSIGMAIWALVIAPLVATFATTVYFWLLLRKSGIAWQVPLTAAAVFLPLGASFGVGIGLDWMLDRQVLAGPTSPGGLGSIVAVRDAGIGFGADFYCDVRVLDANGTVVAEWKGGSQWPRSGPRQLRDSLRWTSPTRLEFTAREGAICLDLP